MGIGLFQLLEQMVRVAMKTVVYSRHKAQTVIASVVLRCAHGTSENIKALEDAGIRANMPLPDWDQRTPYFWQTALHQAEPGKNRRSIDGLPGL